MAKPLPVEAMWKARQLYAEKDSEGRQKYSMIQVAAMLGISEMSVSRAVRNLGRFANVNAKPLPQTRTEEMWAKEIADSQARTLKLLAEPIPAKEKQLDYMTLFSGAPKYTDGTPVIDSVTGRPLESRDAPLVTGTSTAIPPSPLDGGDAPAEADGSGLARLQALAGAGDALLGELQGQDQSKERKDDGSNSSK